MREAITTWDQLWRHRNCKKTYLVQLQPAMILTAWNGGSGNIYYTPWTLAEAAYSDIDFVQLTQGGAALVRCDTSAGLSAAGTCYLNRQEGRLYAHCFNDASPITELMVVCFRQYFAIGTSGAQKEECIFQPAGSAYEVPYKRCLLSLPGINQELPEMLFGGATLSLGRIRFANGRNRDYGGKGPMDDCLQSYIYYGKECTCQIGGEDLPLSQYRPYFTGAVKNIPARGRQPEMEIHDISALALEYKLPDTFYTKAAYPDLEKNAEGKPIPWAFGTCLNVRPTQINTTNWTFKIAAHRIKAITAVRENGIDITGNIAPGSIDLENATFRLAAYASGKTITVDILGYHAPPLYPVFYGDIVKVLLGKALPASAIDTASLTAVNFARPYVCALYVENETKIKDLIADLDETVLAWHCMTREGKFYAAPWVQPTAGAMKYSYEYGVTAKNVRTPLDHSKLYKNVRVGYAKNNCVQADTATKDTEFREDWSHDYLYLPSGENSLTAPLYGCNDTLTVKTLLSRKENAVQVEEERRGLHMMPWIIAEFEAPLQPYRQSLGDVFALTGCRDIPSGVYFMTTKLAETQRGGIVLVRGVTPAAGMIG